MMRITGEVERRDGLGEEGLSLVALSDKGIADHALDTLAPGWTKHF